MHCLPSLRALLLLALLIAFTDRSALAADLRVVRPPRVDRHLRNPGMGFLFYSATGHDPLPEHADVVFACVPVWGQVEKGRGQYDWDLPQIKGVADLARKHGRRWAIRIMPSFQGHPCPIPRWLAEAGVRIFPPDPKWLAHFGQKDLCEPEWWNPKYISAFGDFVRAYGRRFDGEPGLEFIDMRYYGFWGEGHRFGATVPWPKDPSKRKLLKQFIDLHLGAFRRTPLVVQTARDRDEPYPEGTAIDYALSKGCWMRRDGFGGYMHENETRLIESHWRTRPLVAENGAAYADYLDGKVAGWTIDRLIEEMLAHHVSYFPMGWGGQDWQAFSTRRPDLVRKASLRMGYRLIVAEASWPESARTGETLVVDTTWRNLAVARVPYRWHPAAYLLASDGGKRVAGAQAGKADLRAWGEGEDQSLRFSITLPSAIQPGRYAVAVGIEDDRGEPAIELAIEGGDGKRRFVLGKIEVVK